ncbi:hypothetical protein AB0C10_14975 [Microbispora amethystogenes]|uniref:hypothetical protein n=1 Tax=Microbispora amethystogenes TaxID=1427754 RepID=UPI0033D0477F
MKLRCSVRASSRASASDRSARWRARSSSRSYCRRSVAANRQKRMTLGFSRITALSSTGSRVPSARRTSTAISRTTDCIASSGEKWVS